MGAELILAPEAEQDIADAYRWYESIRPGLGEEFLGSVEACLEAVRRAPETYSKVFEEFRRGLLRRFPYAVFYEQESNTVTVYGVLHTARDPAKWRRRLH